MVSVIAKYGRSALFVGALAVTAVSYRTLLRYTNDCELLYRLFVPLFSCFCLIRDRRAIRASVGEPSVVGLVLLVPCLVLGWLGEQGAQIRFEIVSLLCTVVTLVWAVYGVRTVRAVLFPVGFLVFYLCFGAWIMRGDRLSLAMGHVTAESVRLVAGAAGQFAFYRGPSLMIPGLGLAVDTAACWFGSVGLVPCLVMTAAYSYFAQPTNLRRLLLMPFVIPFVVVGNVALAFAGGRGGQYLVLAVCGALVVPTSRLVTKGARRCAGV